jgi:hypothetical protein
MRSNEAQSDDLMYFRDLLTVAKMFPEVTQTIPRNGGDP